MTGITFWLVLLPVKISAIFITESKKFTTYKVSTVEYIMVKYQTPDVLAGVCHSLVNVAEMLFSFALLAYSFISEFTIKFGVVLQSNNYNPKTAFS